MSVAAQAPAVLGAPLKAIYDVLAPAKLNLFLHITGRRSDGYHLLQSVFMLIDWCDTLHFELRADGLITRSDLGGTTLPADDLTLRAARALQRATGTSLGVHIGLEKRIPTQAGMGGGSSDAASCLLALQRLWGVRLPAPALQTIALQLGADVPFFLLGQNAWVEGIGEVLTPVALPAAQFLVVHPGVGLSTPGIFSDPALKRDTETATICSFSANTNSANSSQSGLALFGRNDLQPVAAAQCPAVSQALNWLAAQGLQGRMTGSGSAVFAKMPHDMNIPQAPSAWRVQKCSNLETHPLAGW